MYFEDDVVLHSCFQLLLKISIMLKYLSIQHKIRVAAEWNSHLKVLKTVHSLQTQTCLQRKLHQPHQWSLGTDSAVFLGMINQRWNSLTKWSQSVHDPFPGQEGYTRINKYTNAPVSADRLRLSLRARKAPKYRKVDWLLSISLDKICMFWFRKMILKESIPHPQLLFYFS